MFGQNMFGVGSQQSYTDLQKLQQLQQINQFNNYQVVNQDKYADIQKAITNLSADEKDSLTKDESFMYHNQVYEQGLLAFIASQFRQQYNSTPEGIKCLTELENALETSIKQVKAKVDEERNQMREVAELIKNNPDILKQIKAAKDGNK